jgi:hypothetical protein
VSCWWQTRLSRGAVEKVNIACDRCVEDISLPPLGNHKLRRLWYVVVVRCGTLWYVAVRCGTLWYVVVRCGTLWYVVVRCGTLWYVVVRCGVVRYVVVWCGRMRGSSC